MNGCAGSEPYALQVLGNSMHPEFVEGEVIVVEPGFCSEHGAYVVAMHKGEYIFRQLIVDDRNMLLRPLNDTYPTLMIDEKEMIKGRIIAKSSDRGRRRKSYL